MPDCNDAALGTDRDWLTLGRQVLETEAEGLASVVQDLDGSFVRAVELMAACQGRVAVMGVGKSGLVGRKIAATLSSMGTAALFLHPVESAHGDLGALRPGDVVLAISNSGETDELTGLLPAIKSLEACLIALTSSADSSLGRAADVCVLVRVPKEACPLGLAPTASTTAALAVGDALAVCLSRARNFQESDFARCHPGGALGRRLSRPVAELMRSQQLPLIVRQAPLGQALTQLDQGGLGLVAVVDSGELLVGVLSDGDVRRLAARGSLDLSKPVGSVMTSRPQTVDSTTSAAQAMDIMESRQITVLPVLNGAGQAVGMIHLHDLLGKGSLRFSG